MGASPRVGGLIVLLVIAGLILCGLIALIAGIVALVRINRSEGKLRGKGFAIAAIVIGLLLLLGLPVFGVIGGAALFWNRTTLRQEAMEQEMRAVELRAAEEERALGAEVEGGSTTEKITIKVGAAKDKPEFEIGTWKTDDAEKLADHLKKLKLVGDTPVVVDAVSGCPFRYVMQALDACARAGFTNVQFLTPEAKGSALEKGKNK